MAWNDITNPDAWKLALANLLRKGEDVGQYISEAPTKAGQAIVEAGQKQSALMNKAFDPTGKTLIRDPQAATEAGMNLLSGPLGFAPAGITAWHGSPHTFNKFDITKIGTGEGNQTYGHGMYFAEAPAVATEYKNALSESKFVLNGKNLKDMPSSGGFASMMNEMKKNGKSDLEIVETLKKIGESNHPNAKSAKLLSNKLESGKILYQQSGNLYKVDIPDEHIPMMLDWDKPLLEQTPQVQEALAKLGIKSDKQKLKEFDDVLLESLFSDTSKALPKQPINPTGESIYQTVIQGNPKYTAEKLKEAGITGIRYLDQGSRGKGGTSNFVVFDPTDVKILERNNQPLTRKEILEEELNKLK